MSHTHHSKIITDQELFFNQNALHEKASVEQTLFTEYANKKQVKTLNWLADKKNILD